MFSRYFNGVMTVITGKSLIIVKLRGVVGAIIGVLNEIFHSAHSRWGLVTFVATKVTKKAVSRKASLPHKAFALQINQNHGLQNVAPLRSHWPMLQQLLLCPFCAQGHHCFAWFRPKLFCWRGKFQVYWFYKWTQKQKSGGLTEKRAGCMAGMTV